MGGVWPRRGTLEQGAPLPAPHTPHTPPRHTSPTAITCTRRRVAAGRPAPLQMWWAMATMGVWPAATVVKLDDTPPGIGEARNAGCWAVGLALSGNVAGLSEAELAALGATERAALRASATAELLASGAHLVVDSIADLPAVVTEIEARLARGEGP